MNKKNIGRNCFLWKYRYKTSNESQNRCICTRYNETFSEIYPKIIDKGYSRIPVFEDNIDHIVGVLFVKDLIPHIHKKEFEWDKIIREPFLFQKTRN
jgi:Mg2+/Co2+ transporter CorC